jgi:hypothetical protein
MRTHSLPATRRSDTRNMPPLSTSSVDTVVCEASFCLFVIVWYLFKQISHAHTYSGLQKGWSI